MKKGLGFTEKVDFILAFYSFHEMKYIDDIIQSLKEVAKQETEDFNFGTKKYTFQKKCLTA